MRLYQHPVSSNSRRAVMTALHLRTKVDLVDLELLNPEHRQRLLALNPNNKVPVLEDGDFVLWESHAIMTYLADRTPGQSVYPTDLKARADVNRWLFWCSHHFAPAIAVLNFEHQVKALIGRGGPDPAEVKRGEFLVDQVFRVLDGHLKGRPWISGEKLTLADLSIAAPLMYAKIAKLPLQPFEHVQAWFARIQELEVWKKTELRAT
ncbi:MAG: glutathione S-transferase family protein [Polyangiales bacterium]